MKKIFTILLFFIICFSIAIAQNQAPQVANDNNTSTSIIVNSSYYNRYNDGTTILPFSSSAFLAYTIKSANYGGTQNFRALMPPNYNQNDTKKYPLVINLHGLGESGDSNGNCGSAPCNGNNEKQLTYWASQHQQANNGSYPAFYIFPQCVTTYWNNGQEENGYMMFKNQNTGQPYNPSDAVKRVLQLIDFIVNGGITSNGVKFNIDPERVYVMGYSLGGNGTFDMLMRRQDLIAAGIPVSVTGDRYEPKNMAYMPVWYWQGTNDGLFPASKARVVKDSLMKYAGVRRDNQFTNYQWNTNDINQYVGNKRYTEVSSSGHDTWTFAIQHPDLYRWLFSQNKLKINAFGDTTIASGGSVKIGVTPGFAEYQWKRDATLLSFITNEIITSTPGNYYVRIRRSTLGWSDWSQPITISNPTPDTQNPTAPTNLTAAEITNTSFKLSWTPSTDNVGIAGYDIFRDGVKINTSNITTTYYAVSELTQNTSYNMTVQARDTYGNTSTISSPLVVTTANNSAPVLEATWILNFGWQYSSTVSNYNNLFPSSFPLAAGTSFNNLIKNDGSSSGVALALNSSLSGGGNTSGCTGSSFADAATKSWWRIENSEVMSAKITGLSTSKTYSFTFFHNSGTDDARAIYAINGISQTLNGKTNCSNTVVFSNLQPNASGEIIFSLSRNAGYYQAGINLLKIEQMSSATQPQANDTLAPSKPAGLTSSNITSTSFTLSWTASTDNIGVTGYDVFQNNTLVTSVSATSAIITGLSPAASYSMTVKAKDAAGNISATSSVLNVTTSSSGSATLEATWIVNLGWQYSTRVTNYNNLFPTSFPVAAGTNFNNLIKNDGSSSTTGFTITQAVPGGGNSGCTTGTYQAGGGSWWRVQNSQTMAFKFTGLQTNKYYSIILFHSSGSNNALSNFTIQGATKSLAGQNNCSTTVSFDNLQPNASGEIEIQVSRNSQYYEAGLNVIELRQFSASSQRTSQQVATKNTTPESESGVTETLLYPNPSQGIVNVVYYSDKEQVITINITDALGRKVKEIRQPVQMGKNDLQVDLTKHQTGKYFIQLNREKSYQVLLEK